MFCHLATKMIEYPTPKIRPGGEVETQWFAKPRRAGSIPAPVSRASTKVFAECQGGEIGRRATLKML